MWYLIFLPLSENAHRGITVQQLYQDSLAKVYTLRLGGAEHVEVYNLERKTDDIKRLLEEKQRAGQEPQGEVDEGQQGEPRPTDPAPKEQGGNHQSLNKNFSKSAPYWCQHVSHHQNEQQ